MGERTNPPRCKRGALAASRVRIVAGCTNTLGHAQECSRALQAQQAESVTPMVHHTMAASSSQQSIGLLIRGVRVQVPGGQPSSSHRGASNGLLPVFRQALARV